MKDHVSLQERLKDLRVEKGLKLEELAEKTGISKSALASYENEENRNKEINHGNLITLADFYEVSIDYLFCRLYRHAEKPYGAEAGGKDAGREKGAATAGACLFQDPPHPGRAMTKTSPADKTLRFIILLLARWTCPNNCPTYPTQ